MEDWKTKLETLRNAVPQAEEPEEVTTGEDVQVKNSAKEKLNIVFERKGRAGKSATIIEGFRCGDEELREVAKRLQKKLATGGSARCGEILLQGDCRERVAKLLREEGYRC